MPVTVNSMAAVAPARTWTRRSPNRGAGAFLPPSVTVGLVIRSRTGLTSAVPWPAVSACNSRSLIACALACRAGRLGAFSAKLSVTTGDVRQLAMVGTPVLGGRQHHAVGPVVLAV